MGLGTDPSSERTSDLPSGEAEGRTQVLTRGKEDSSLADQGITEIQSPASLKNNHTRPITTRGGDPQNLQSTHEPTIMKLPPELLSLIFTNCRESQDTAVILPRTRWFPWAPGQVCSQWREILGSMTGIWSEIQIRSGLSQKKQEDLPWLVEQVMTRARGLVSLRMPFLEVAVFTKVIMPYTGRFQSLRLTLSSDLLGIFLNLPSTLSSLRLLDIIIIDEPLLHPVMTRQTGVLRDASHLDTFYITYLCYPESLNTVYALNNVWLPWSQLTFFECSGIHSIADLHDILSQCTALNECKIKLHASLEGETAGHTRKAIGLSHLQTLSLEHRFSGSTDWASFLEPFVLPSLESLDCDSWGALEAFGALVSRSGCHLKELKFFMDYSFTDPLNVDHLYNLLRMSPSLAVLGTLPLSPLVFNRISRGELLPHIAILVCSVDVDGFGAFLDLMEQYPAGRGIHAAYISLYIPPNPEASEKDEVIYRYGCAGERFLAEGRDIKMEIIAD